jgi:hypothetical protein
VTSFQAQQSRATSKWIARLTGAATIVIVVLWGAAPAGAYTFGEPTVRQIGSQTTPFDWSVHKCVDNDIPDQPARAFREANGTINFLDTHFTAWRNTTSDLVTFTHRCTPTMMTSSFDGDPSKYDDKQWLAAPWTSDGVTVYSLVHQEYQGWRYASGGYCIRSGETASERQQCWYNSVTLAVSTDGGSTFSHATPPGHLVASSPEVFVRGEGPTGFFQPSNIVRGQDGWHYFLSRVMSVGVQPIGTCVMRSRNIADPTSWRGWSGSDFTVRFPNPYLSTVDPAEHVCQPASYLHIGTLSESVTWSTYFKKWMLVGSSDNADGASGPGFYFFLSDDLINWDRAQLLMQAELPWTYKCGDQPYVRDPSLLDPVSSSRNFDTIGQRPYLFFTRFNLTSCTSSLDRDLLRIPVEFTNQVPGGPSAALAASTSTPRTGEPVTFDASRSSDADGSITGYEWDLDGDGTYERESGAPVISHTYDKPAAVTVTVRVRDDDGKATDDTVALEVGGPEIPAETGAAAEAPPQAVGRTSAAAAAQAVGRFRIVRSRARRGGALVNVRVPAAGRLEIRAAGRRVIRATSVNATRAGVLAVRIRATRGALRRRNERGTLRARARFAFTPVGGARQTATRTLVLRAR